MAYNLEISICNPFELVVVDFDRISETYPEFVKLTSVYETTKVYRDLQPASVLYFKILTAHSQFFTCTAYMIPRG